MLTGESTNHRVAALTGKTDSPSPRSSELCAFPITGKPQVNCCNQGDYTQKPGQRVLWRYVILHLDVLHLVAHLRFRPANGGLISSVPAVAGQSTLPPHPFVPPLCKLFILLKSRPHSLRRQIAAVPAGPHHQRRSDRNHTSKHLNLRLPAVGLRGKYSRWADLVQEIRKRERNCSLTYNASPVVPAC
jgi:hypothetical protein